MQIPSTLSNVFEKNYLNIQRVIPIVFFALSITIVTITIVETFHYHHPIIFWDHLWLTVNEVSRLFSGEYKFSELFSQVNEHRLTIPRLFIFMDYIFFQGKSIFLVISNFSIQFLHLIILMILYRHSFNHKISLIVPTSLVAAMMFSILQDQNFFFGFSVQFVGEFVAASCAFLSYAIALEQNAKGKSLIFPILSMLASMIIASLMMANGAFVGLALLVLTLLQRQTLCINLAICFITATILFSYIYGFVPASISIPYSNVWSHPVGYILFSLTYLGNPFVIFGYFTMRIFGCLGVLVLLYGCWLVWTRKVTKSGQLALLGISIFIVATVVGTAIGRFGFDIEFGSRYITIGFIFWSTQILFWMSINLVGFHERLRKLALVIIPSFICISITVAQVKSLYLRIHPSIFLMGPLKHIFWYTGPERKASFDAAADALISDVYDYYDTLWAMSPVYDYYDTPWPMSPTHSASQKRIIWEGAQFLKAYRLSIFADPVSFWVGRKLSDVLIISPNIGTCQGAIDHIAPIVETSTPHGVHVGGWAWNITEKAPIKRILLVNQDDIIIGVASGGLSMPSLPTDLKNIKSEFIGWKGFAKLPADGEIKAVGIINNNKEACLF